MSNQSDKFTYEELIDNLDESESLEEMSQNLEKLSNKINHLVQLIWQQLIT